MESDGNDVFFDKAIFVNYGIEMKHPSGTPYIDFHSNQTGSWDNTISDYTTRIIESTSQTL
mgnify:FL=1